MREYDLIAVLEGRHSHPPEPSLQMISLGELTAVLSATPRPLHRPAQSLHQHLDDAATHLARQTACMHMAPLLPVRLETPLTTEGTLRFLAANEPFLAQLLTRFAGMAQVQVTVSWSEADVPARFAQEAEFAGLSANSLPEAVARAVHHMALRLSATIGADLASVATEIAPLPLAPGLIWSGVVLMPLRRLGDLNRILQKVRAIWPEGIHVRQIGPDPVTSFATLDLFQVTARQVDRAMADFGLNALTDLGQLALARRRRLVTPPWLVDTARRDEIADQAEVLSAASRLPSYRDGFALCRIWADGRVALQPQTRAVA